MKRFYTNVALARENDGFAVLLDGKAVKTPARAPLVLPHAELGEAVAAEWREQGEVIHPETMRLTKLANTAIDRVAPHRPDIIAQLLAYGGTDLLCYRAESPAALTRRQAAMWDPILDWLAEQYGARLSVGTGITFIQQPAEALAALERALNGAGDLQMAGLHAAAAALGSLALAQALATGRIGYATAFEASRLDEDFQAEAWGRDFEAEQRERGRLDEIKAIDRFFRLLGPGTGS